MKQVFLKLTGKKLITAAFLSASVLLTSFSVNAAHLEAISKYYREKKQIFNLQAVPADALMFKVNINNEKGDNFTVTIKNDDGDVLFSKSFNDVEFSKKFKVVKRRSG